MSWYSRHVLAVSGLLVVSQIVFVSLPITASGDDACAARQRWAQRYTHAQPTLDDLAQLDRARQIAVFNAITPAARAHVWRDQLTRAARQRELTDTQRTLLREGAVLMTPALYAHDAPATQAFEAFWRRAEPAFPAAHERRLWFEIGAVVPTAVRATSATALDRLTRPFRATAQMPPRCTCYRFEFAACTWPEYCRPAACQPSSWGCGSAALSPCDGQCG